MIAAKDSCTRKPENELPLTFPPLPADRSCADIPGHIPALGPLGLLWHRAEQAVGPGSDPSLPGTRHLHPLLDGLSGHEPAQALPPGNGKWIAIGGGP